MSDWFNRNGLQTGFFLMASAINAMHEDMGLRTFGMFAIWALWMLAINPGFTRKLAAKKHKLGGTR